MLQNKNSIKNFLVNLQMWCFKTKLFFFVWRKACYIWYRSNLHIVFTPFIYIRNGYYERKISNLKKNKFTIKHQGRCLQRNAESHWKALRLVKGLWLCLWELWHSVINTTQNSQRKRDTFVGVILWLEMRVVFSKHKICNHN